MKAKADGSWGTFQRVQPFVVRGVEEERRAARGRSQFALCTVAVAILALLALASHSSGRTNDENSKTVSLATKKAELRSTRTVAAGKAAQSMLSQEARRDQLWASTADKTSSKALIAVTEDDINALGLRAPTGFNVPGINVTGDDIERLGLRAPAGFNVPGINVSESDIDRLGLRAPDGFEDQEMVVTEADKERYGLVPLTASAGSAGGEVQVTSEDVERYGLVLPQAPPDVPVNVTEEDVTRYGLSNPTITEDEAKALGIFGDGPEVTSDDVETYGMNLAPPTPEEAAALGLSNSTVRLNAEEAANLGLLGPVSLTPEEAEKLGLHQQASGALVTQEDMDRLGLNDPVGWNASGFSHLSSIPAVSRAVDAQVTLKAREMVEQLMNQKQRVVNKRHAGK